MVGSSRCRLTTQGNVYVFVLVSIGYNHVVIFLYIQGQYICIYPRLVRATSELIIDVWSLEGSMSSAK